jgi:hypothetical protein
MYGRHVRTLALCLMIIAKPQSISCFLERASLNCLALRREERRGEGRKRGYNSYNVREQGRGRRGECGRSRGMSYMCWIQDKVNTLGSGDGAEIAHDSLINGEHR